jgi:O-acetyl-ADP-ribose deacetylase (regulator of RNase III)
MNSNLLVSVIIVVASASILIWLLLFFLGIRKKNERQSTTLAASVPFLALSIAMFLFLLFPGSTSSGVFFGISVSGAVALFMLAWYFGNQIFQKTLIIDRSIEELNQEKRKLQDELQALKRQGTPGITVEDLPHGIPYKYQVRGKRGKKIALITGRIEEVKIADIWVSSENTDMQMARFYDRSISGTIRYLGAKRDASLNVIDDIIAKELRNVVGTNKPVAPTAVFVTDSGELQKGNNVKKIFHVAAVHGEYGVGYKPVENIQYCVTNSLQRVETEDYRSLNFKSILFPLLGAGTAVGKPEKIAQYLIQAAVTYFETATNSQLEYIYFIARTNIERDACLATFQQLEQSGELEAFRR